MKFSLRMSAFVGGLLAILLILVIGTYLLLPRESAGGWYSGTVEGPAPDERPKSMLTQKWQSTGGIRYTREFMSNGTVIDTFDSTRAAASGRWNIVNPILETDIPVSAEDLARMTVIKILFDTNDTLYFGVNSLTENELRLRNLSSGKNNILIYKRAD